MAQQLQKLFQSGGGIPKGTGVGLQLLGAAAVIGYGISQSMYTGRGFFDVHVFTPVHYCHNNNNNNDTHPLQLMVAIVPSYSVESVESRMPSMGKVSISAYLGSNTP